jgi:hypothetical protein
MALGMSEDLEPEMVEVLLSSGDILILCTQPSKLENEFSQWDVSQMTHSEILERLDNWSKKVTSNLTYSIIKVY